MSVKFAEMAKVYPQKHCYHEIEARKNPHKRRIELVARSMNKFRRESPFRALQIDIHGPRGEVTPARAIAHYRDLALSATHHSVRKKHFVQLITMYIEFYAEKVDALAETKSAILEVFDAMQLDFQEDVKYSIWKFDGEKDTGGSDHGGELFRANPFANNCYRALFDAVHRKRHWHDVRSGVEDQILSLESLIKHDKKTFYHGLFYFYQLYHVKQDPKRDAVIQKCYSLLHHNMQSMLRLSCEVSAIPITKRLITKEFEGALRSCYSFCIKER